MVMKNNKRNIFKLLIEKFYSIFQDKKTRRITGLLFLLFSIFLLASFISYLFNGQIDQDKLENFSNEIKNIGGNLGNMLAHKFIFHWFGISSFILPFTLFFIGFKLFFERYIFSNSKFIYSSIFFVLWISILFGFITKPSILSGVFGIEINKLLNEWLGKIGTILILFFSFCAYIIIKFNPKLFKKKNKIILNKDETPPIVKENLQEEIIENNLTFENKKVIKNNNDNSSNNKDKIDIESDTEIDLNLEVKKIEDEDLLSQKEISNKIEDLGEYDPTLDLSNYKLPSINILNEYGSGKIEVDKDELELNKNKIVETLANYKIGISSINATVGPTITLYEIVPEAGIRISKIKNLEDDIALSLSALGIRIIAPIPGKGTIGIEVPNQNPATVSMKTVLSSDKFQNSELELPIALGKTISNQTFVADLAKMPHLLMAGATGQGKSVGLNAILASLLYKKHPAQVKFVLVDPKKVELTLFNKIEKHFLAKLPNSEEAIITDTKKVINTLNSLCIEMDQRYDLLQKAQCRNISEYNNKFINRKLNPNNGHRYLPYIVLVIDEFADLIMTAGKEVETPIARLAQLARAIGIHLIIATQRPSVNVITGIIKANFPARVAFRVTSKIDSRTILDAGGADQLIGRGDMLVSLGSDLVRVQCAFIDTPEVEKLTEFISKQKSYPEAFLLPEYVNENEGNNLNASLDDKDSMFEEAARIVVMHQSGSTSLIQRKLKLGYNRAGRIIDQLEVAGIVGPFEGSKARQVLVTDELTLEELLKKL